MFFYEGYSCPVCGKVFTESDDVVVCPACGAPHHRECWKQEGHCHFEETHGTPQQWTREQSGYTQVNVNTEKQENGQRCPHCGHDNSVFAEFCSHCGKELQAKEWYSEPHTTQQEQPPFSPFGGYSEYRPFHAPAPDVSVPDDTDIDGVSAKELRLFVGQNTQHYIPRFHKLAEKQGSFSWNWAAFLLTPYWLWYRKQRFAGSIVLLLEAVRSIISAFFLYGYIGFSNIITNEELVARLEQLTADGTFRQWVLVMYLFLFISVLIRIFFGAFGNYLYYRFAKKRILKLREHANTVAIVAVGGTSTVLAITAYVVLYLVSTFSNFIFL